MARARDSSLSGTLKLMQKLPSGHVLLFEGSTPAFGASISGMVTTYSPEKRIISRQENATLSQFLTDYCPSGAIQSLRQLGFDALARGQLVRGASRRTMRDISVR